MVFGVALGVLLVVPSILLTRRNSAALARRRGVSAVSIERVVWAVYLVFAALIYVGFGLREAGRPWLHVEFAGVIGFGLVAWLGARRWPLALALGWAAHAPWDFWLHGDVPSEFVPSWYREACLVFDLIAAAYLARRARD